MSTNQERLAPGVELEQTLHTPTGDRPLAAVADGRGVRRKQWTDLTASSVPASIYLNHRALGPLALGVSTILGIFSALAF